MDGSEAESVKEIVAFVAGTPTLPVPVKVTSIGLLIHSQRTKTKIAIKPRGMYFLKPGRSTEGSV